MALKHGTAGKSTREMEMRRYFSRVFVVLAGIAIVEYFTGFHLNSFSPC
jgi:cation transporter-like permease